MKPSFLKIDKGDEDAVVEEDEETIQRKKHTKIND